MFSISPDTQALTDRLAAVPYGEQVTYAELSDVVGRNIQTQNTKYLLYAALRRACNEHGAVFENVRKVGYRRLTAEEADKIGHSARRGVRRKVRRAAREMTAIISRSNGVSNEAQLRTNRELSQMGLIEMASKDRFLHKADKLEKPEPVAKVAQKFLEDLLK